MATARRRVRRTERRNRGSDLGARVLAAIPLIGLALFLVLEGGSIFAFGLIVIAVLCLHEYYELVRDVHPMRLAGFLAVIGMILSAHYGDQFQMLLVTAAAFPLTFVLLLASPVRRGATVSMAATIFGALWIGLAFAHAVLLRDLPHGDGIVIDVLVATFIGDTGAYFGGRGFGERPLAPAISPNKTVEGLLCGMVTAIAAAWFAGLYQDWLSGTDALILGAAVAVAAPLGDLFESLVKRDAGVKDTGGVFGAHGGALDRLDAVMFAVVAGYYVWVALL